MLITLNSSFYYLGHQNTLYEYFIKYIRYLEGVDLVNKVIFFDLSWRPPLKKLHDFN